MVQLNRGGPGGQSSGKKRMEPAGGISPQESTRRESCNTEQRNLCKRGNCRREESPYERSPAGLRLTLTGRGVLKGDKENYRTIDITSSVEGGEKQLKTLS